MYRDDFFFYACMHACITHSLIQISSVSFDKILATMHSQKPHQLLVSSANHNMFNNKQKLTTTKTAEQQNSLDLHY